MSNKTPKGNYKQPIELAVEHLLDTFDFRKNTLTNIVEIKAKNQTKFEEVNENDLCLLLKIQEKLKVSMSDILVFLGSKYI